MTATRFFSNHLRLKNSLISGKVGVRKNHFGEHGVFVKEKIYKNEIIAVACGNIFPRQEHLAYTPDLQKYAWQIDDDYFMGPKRKSDLDITDYFNHSCDPNLGVIGNNVLVAMRDVKAGEELAFDYATLDTLDNDFNCLCGTKLCRGRVRGDDWKRPELQKRYGQYFSWYILKKIKKQKKK